jgi:hypothetical protein
MAYTGTSTTTLRKYYWALDIAWRGIECLGSIIAGAVRNLWAIWPSSFLPASTAGFLPNRLPLFGFGLEERQRGGLGNRDGTIVPCL